MGGESLIKSDGPTEVRYRVCQVHLYTSLSENSLSTRHRETVQWALTSETKLRRSIYRISPKSSYSGNGDNSLTPF